MSLRIVLKLDLKRCADQMILLVSEDAEQQIQTLFRQLREVELMVKDAEVRVKVVEKRVEAQASEMAKQMKDSESVIAHSTT
jgi:hypothetical protein